MPVSWQSPATKIDPILRGRSAVKINNRPKLCVFVCACVCESGHRDSGDKMMSDISNALYCECVCGRPISVYGHLCSVCSVI